MPDDLPDLTTTRFEPSWLLIGAGAAIALCVGIWVGFKLAGGEVAGPCPDCAQRHDEAAAVVEPEVADQ